MSKRRYIQLLEAEVDRLKGQIDELKDKIDPPRKPIREMGNKMAADMLGLGALSGSSTVPIRGPNGGDLFGPDSKYGMPPGWKP